MGTAGEATTDPETQVVSSRASQSSASIARPPTVEPGARLGRYEVREVVGHGGMGEVVRAYDPQLDREVAVKRVRSDLLGDVAQARLAREAQAMAQLAHPNVVPVFDVEIHDDAVYVAMEYVAGGTLADWLDTPRPWQEVVAAFCEAARGLDAAHQAGLVHRDFKLTNVLRTADGQFKVTDFGLAKPAGTEPSELGSVDRSSSMSGDTSLTRAGSVMGTPAYMAPEQHYGWELDGRADQFAFCVGLWRALTGAYPFDARRLEEAKAEGPPPWPARTSVPKFVARAIRRGLAHEADERFASMAALIDALQPRARRVRWGYGLAAVGIGAAAALGIVAGLDAGPRCEGVAQLAEVWNPAREREAAAGFRAAAGDDATWSSLRDRMDGYGQDWSVAYDEVCQSTASDDVEASLVDEQVSCLMQARARLSSTADLFTRADADTVRKASELVERLTDLASCTDPERVRSGVAPPADPTVAREVDALAEALAAAKTLRDAARYQEVLETVEPLVARAEATGYEPILAKILLTRGENRMSLGSFETALADFERAYELATRQGMVRTALVAAERYGFVAGTRLSRLDEAERMGRMALSLAERVGKPGHLAAVHSMLSGTYNEMGDLVRAEKHMRESLRYMEEDENLAPVNISLGRRNLGTLLLYAGRYEEAEVELRAAVASAIEVLGPEHNYVASHKSALGAVLDGLGRYDEAEAMLLEVVQWMETATDLEATQPGKVHSALAGVYASKGDHRKAREHYEIALKNFTDELGPDAVLAAKTKANLSSTLSALGEYAAAERAAQESIRTIEQVVGPEHHDIAALRIKLSGIYQSQGRWDEAEAEARRALDLAERTLGDAHERTGLSYRRLGQVLAAQDRHAEALEALERAVEIYGRTPGEPADVAEAKRELAAELWRVREQRPRAVALAQEALAGFAKLGVAFEPRRAETQAWLATHRLP